MKLIINILESTQVVRHRVKKKRQPKTHDKIIGLLEGRLEGQINRTVLTEHKFKHCGDHEADVLVYSHDKRYGYAIEVKTTDTPKATKKAYWQLRADRRYLMDRFKIKKVYTFYAHKAKNNIYTINRVML